jgi:pimeloyl-ACP methyl ester carboxylesterase
MTVTSGQARWPFVPLALGMLLAAAGAADGHDLVAEARDHAEWCLLIGAVVGLLGGFWLLSGRFALGARVAAIAACGGMLSYDLTRAVAGDSSHIVFGRIAVVPGWAVFGDLLVGAGLLRWRPTPNCTARMSAHPVRSAVALLVAVASGVAIDRSQVGQFPILTTVRSGRTSSGLDYLVYLPDRYYRSARSWPLILSLHGGGEAGDDIQRVRRQGLPLRVEEKGGLQFVIVAPQCPYPGWDVGALGVLLEEVLSRYRVDTDRVYLVGHSMGGTGAWALAARSPERFAAIAPICGGGDPASAGQLRGVPTWAFHGADDHIVPLERSTRMIAALKEAGGDGRLTVYPGVGHDAWTQTYANAAFYEWLLRHTRRSRMSLKPRLGPEC